MATVADGIRYAGRVVSGEILAGDYVRLACQRFLDDLQNGEERGIVFSQPRAQHVLDFYRFLPHVKGDLAGQPIQLMDWHVFILINLFGFLVPLVDEQTGAPVLKPDGQPVRVRRFRTAYNEVARKNAKSTLSSGIALYMTGADGEGGAEVYSAATTRDQARIVFDDAKTMIKKAPLTLGRFFDFNKLAIYQASSASRFQPLSSDAHSLDGLNIHGGIVDELHAQKTRDVWDVLETGTGARLQSLLFGITTAGFNKEGICYELRDCALKVLQGFNSTVEGAIQDDTFFALIYTLDKDDDPFDERVWLKANPGLGICKRADDVRRLASKAKEQVAARHNFLTKHLNVWVTTESAWMDMPQATQTILDDAFFNVEAWINSELAIEFSEQEERAFTQEDGIKKPKGFLAYPSALFGTLQHLLSGAASTLTADALIELVYSLRKVHRQGAKFMMNNKSLFIVRTLKDLEGNYLWRPGIEVGQPSTLPGYGIAENEQMPDMAANAKPVAFGSFKRGYSIVDRIGHPYLTRPLYTQALCELLYHQTHRRDADRFTGHQAVANRENQRINRDALNPRRHQDPMPPGTRDNGQR